MSVVTTIEEHTLVPRVLGPDSVVIDLGGNVGAFSSEMVRRFGCTCHAVEPDPAMAAQIPSGPRLHVYQHAVDGERGEATFHVCEDDPLGSSLHPAASLDYVRTLTVPVETLSGVMERVGAEWIDLVKVDIEGAEVSMFEACPDRDLRRVGQYTVEFHDFNGVTPRVDVVRVLDRFRDLGFEVYRKSHRNHCDVLVLDAERLGVSAAELAWVRTGRHYLTGAGRLLKIAARRAGL